MRLVDNDRFEKLACAIEELKKAINDPTALHFVFTRSSLASKVIDVIDAWDEWTDEEPQ
jgi:hypothetical protein